MEAVIRFLAAYLADEGELARYVAPDAGLASVLPLLFTSVEILDAESVPAADGARRFMHHPVLSIRSVTNGVSRSSYTEVSKGFCLLHLLLKPSVDVWPGSRSTPA